MSTKDEWSDKLSKEAYNVLRKKGTEAPFSGDLLYNEKAGTYVCGACGSELFSSKHKYDSSTPGLIGWPSFSEVKDNKAITLKPDDALLTKRTEVTCTTCGGHLGHVFNAVDSPTGQHYCINSVALSFKKAKS